jgi:putative transcriptional regulator
MKEDTFKELVASIKQGGAILRGEAKARRTFVFDVPAVRRFRDNHDLSQAEFASLLGISVRTLQNWEQGRREPEGPAKVLLQVAAKHPEAVWDVVKPIAKGRRSTARLVGKSVKSA